MFRLEHDMKKNEFSFECEGCSNTISYKHGAMIPLNCPVCKSLIATRPDQLYESTYYRRGYYMSRTHMSYGGV